MSYVQMSDETDEYSYDEEPASYPAVDQSHFAGPITSQDFTTAGASLYPFDPMGLLYNGGSYASNTDDPQSNSMSQSEAAGTSSDPTTSDSLVYFFPSSASTERGLRVGTTLPLGRIEDIFSSCKYEKVKGIKYRRKRGKELLTTLKAANVYIDESCNKNFKQPNHDFLRSIGGLAEYVDSRKVAYLGEPQGGGWVLKSDTTTGATMVLESAAQLSERPVTRSMREDYTTEDRRIYDTYIAQHGGGTHEQGKTAVYN